MSGRGGPDRPPTPGRAAPGPPTRRTAVPSTDTSTSTDTTTREVS
ncbi:hypothetical protein [Streptomyces sp. NBC_01716]|nr:hypothetical protein [Streptomyces sp. NBC_01716]